MTEATGDTTGTGDGETAGGIPWPRVIPDRPPEPRADPMADSTDGAASADTAAPDTSAPDTSAPGTSAPDRQGREPGAAADVATAADATDAAGATDAADRTEAPDAADTADRPPLRTLVEAVLMVAEKPVGVAEFATGLEALALDVERVLAELAAEYRRDGRGFDLRHVGGGWRFYTAEDCAPWVEKFVLAGQMSRLSQAALETLAVVAYQQPVSRGRISAVRGVSADGVIRTLTARGLVEEATTDPETGAILYRTTDYFLERMGLRSLDELPPLAPLLPGIDDIEDIIAP
ncbi:SMC-Scp complex subunit ScpB [Pseudofrankia sp. BMG5.36]|uniref:SMC-Scp complex subunit ScpB n=1 Tax=Pseudofrankia sp. BMG5.36 TaxID=1834512 RepID=UPI002683A630